MSNLHLFSLSRLLRRFEFLLARKPKNKNTPLTYKMVEVKVHIPNNFKVFFNVTVTKAMMPQVRINDHAVLPISVTGDSMQFFYKPSSSARELLFSCADSTLAVKNPWFFERGNQKIHCEWNNGKMVKIPKTFFPYFDPQIDYQMNFFVGEKYKGEFHLVPFDEKYFAISLDQMDEATCQGHTCKFTFASNQGIEFYLEH